jgi:hypothetical protein
VIVTPIASKIRRDLSGLAVQKFFSSAPPTSSDTFTLTTSEHLTPRANVGVFHQARLTMFKFSSLSLAGAIALSAALSLGAASAVQAQATTKDIVLLRVSTPPQPVVVAQAPQPGDAMAVSVLLESADGSLTPRGTDALFRTGDRFRVKLVASRSGKVWLFNTTPDGVLQSAPVWQGEVRHGQELITPRLRLEGRSGVDQLHVVMEPDPVPPSAYIWLREWLVVEKADKSAGGAEKSSATPAAGDSSARSKDIRLDVQNTPTTTYLLNPIGRGLVTTVQISHR